MKTCSNIKTSSTIHGFHHTSFTVSNVEEAEQFFVGLFSMKRIGGGLYDFDYVRRQVGYPDAKLKIAVLAFGDPPDRGRGVLELVEYLQPRGAAADTATNRPGNAHLCFLVEDLESEYQRLRAAGVRFKSTPNEVTFGVNKGAKAVYFNGPDNIALELLQPPPAVPNAENEPRKLSGMDTNKGKNSSAVNNK